MTEIAIDIDDYPASNYSFVATGDKQRAAAAYALAGLKFAVIKGGPTGRRALGLLNPDTGVFDMATLTDSMPLWGSGEQALGRVALALFGGKEIGAALGGDPEQRTRGFAALALLNGFATVTGSS